MLRFLAFLMALMIMSGLGAPIFAQSVQLVSLETTINSDVSATMVRNSLEPVMSGPQRLVLPNGLKVILLEEHSVPAVSCLVWYKFGSRNDEAGATGLCHLVEHLLFKNIGNFKKNEWGANVVRHGGQFNGFTSEDFTVFYSTVPPSQIELSLKGEADRMRQAKFTQADVRAEVSNLLREINQESKDPLATLTKEVQAAAFQKHPYRNPPCGLPVDIEHLTWEKAHEFYEKYFYPNNATLVLVGDFHSASIVNLIRKHFAPLPKSIAPLPEVRVKEANPLTEGHVLVKTNGKKECLLVAYHAPCIADRDAPAMVVLEAFLNNQITGRLKTKLLDSKICSYAQSVFEIKRDPGLFVVTLNPAAGVTLDRALDGFDSVLSKWSSQSISNVELNRARRQAEFEFYNESDGPLHTGLHLGYFETLLKPQETTSWVDKLRSVTASDIARVVDIYLKPNTRVVGELSAAPPAPPPAAKPLVRSRPLPPGKIMMQRTPAAQVTPDGRGYFSYARRAAYKSEDSSIEPLLQAETSLTGEDTEKPGASASENEQTAEHRNHQSKTEQTDSPAVSETGHVIGVKTSSGAEQTNTDSANICQKRLDNGLNVIVVQSRFSPIVQLVGSTQAGRVYEASDKHGVSELLAMTMNYGNINSNRQQVIAEQNDIGLPPKAMLQFEAGIEKIGFKTRCLSKDLNIQLKLLASALREPRCQDADVEKAKAELLANMSQNIESVNSRAERALFRSLIAPVSPYYPSAPGEMANSLNCLKSSEVKDFHDACVLPDTTTLVVLGDVEPKPTLKAVESIFSDWSSPRTAPSRPPLVVSNRQSSKSSLIVKEGQQNVVCLGRIIADQSNAVVGNRYADDWYRLLIADCVLSNHPIFSRITQRFDYEPTLVTNFTDDQLKSRLKPISGAVIWSLSLPLSASAGSPDAVFAIQNELKRFAASGITMREFNEAKRYLLGAIPISQTANLQQLSESILDHFVAFGNVNSFVREPLIFSDVSLDSVNKYIAARFKPENSSLVVAGSRQLIKQIHNYAASTIPVRTQQGN